MYFKSRIGDYQQMMFPEKRHSRKASFAWIETYTEKKGRERARRVKNSLSKVSHCSLCKVEYDSVVFSENNPAQMIHLSGNENKD